IRASAAGPLSSAASISRSTLRWSLLVFAGLCWSLLVFAGLHVDFDAVGRDYGERRTMTAGWLDRRMVMMVWTARGDARHVISMRCCHAKEVRKILDIYPE